MKLRTTLIQPEFKSKVSYLDPIFSVGSCFSVEMTERLAVLKYEVLSNPCGISYNPASLLRSIKRVSEPNSLHAEDLNYLNGLYSHPDFHGSFNHTDQNVFIERAQNSLLEARKHLVRTKLVLITVGTCFVFRSKKTKEIVNNCHKQHADLFTKELLPLQEVITLLNGLRTEVQALSEQPVQFLWAVSPIRHIKNGLVNDRKSKSIALLAVHKLVDQHVDCHYFPSYELVIDELRDYRFYNEDLIHPNKVASDYIFEVFESALLLPEEAELRSRLEAITKRSNHRALFPETEAHHGFLEKLAADIRILKKEFPFIASRL